MDANLAAFSGVASLSILTHCWHVFCSWWKREQGGAGGPTVPTGWCGFGPAPSRISVLIRIRFSAKSAPLKRASTEAVEEMEGLGAKGSERSSGHIWPHGGSRHPLLCLIVLHLRTASLKIITFVPRERRSKLSCSSLEEPDVLSLEQQP